MKDLDVEDAQGRVELDCRANLLQMPLDNGNDRWKVIQLDGVDLSKTGEKCCKSWERCVGVDERVLALSFGPRVHI